MRTEDTISIRFVGVWIAFFAVFNTKLAISAPVAAGIGLL